MTTTYALHNGSGQTVATTTSRQAAEDWARDTGTVVAVRITTNDNDNDHNA